MQGNNIKFNMVIMLILLGLSWLNTSGKMVQHYDIFQHHGAGGAAPITKGMLDFF